MKARYIDADIAIKEALQACNKLFREKGKFLTSLDAIDIVEALDEIPTADVVKVKYGEWKFHPDGSGTCSACGKLQNQIWDMDHWQNFCGHCGADMRGEINNVE